MERTIISFDYAIKEILRNKANFDILSGFLTELIEKQVTVLDVLESEGNSTTFDGKVNRLDLKAKMDDGELAVFEIQFFDQIDFLGKILFNTCKAVVEQVSAGALYDVKKVYSVNIRTTKSKFDEWVYVLKHSAVKSEFTAAGIQAAGEKLNILKMTPQQRAEYEADQQMKMTHKSQLYTAELKGRIEGRVEGRIEGRVEGEEIGLLKEKRETVFRGRNNGLSIETIAKVTNLSIEQIRKILKEENKNEK